MPAQIDEIRPKFVDVARWNTQFCNRECRFQSHQLSSCTRLVIEEIDETRFERVLGAHDDQTVFLDELLEYLRPMAQVAGRHAHVRANRVAHECVGIVPQLGSQQRLDRRPHAVNDRVEIFRLADGRPVELFDGGENGAALRVSQHDDKPRAVTLGGEFDTADLRWRNDVAGDADDEEIAEALVEDDFRRHARIGAAQNNRERLLAGGNLYAARFTSKGIVVTDVRHKPVIAVFQALEGVLRWHHKSAIVVRARTNSVRATTLAPNTVASYDIFAPARSRSASEYCARPDHMCPHCGHANQRGTTGSRRSTSGWWHRGHVTLERSSKA
jgi:hypothetical protein